jgi:hypothetical protein
VRQLDRADRLAAALHRVVAGAGVLVGDLHLGRRAANIKPCSLCKKQARSWRRNPFY